MILLVKLLSQNIIFLKHWNINFIFSPNCIFLITIKSNITVFEYLLQYLHIYWNVSFTPNDLYRHIWQCLLSVPFESIFVVVLNVVCQLLNKLYPGIQPRLKICIYFNLTWYCETINIVSELCNTILWYIRSV